MELYDSNDQFLVIRKSRESPSPVQPMKRSNRDSIERVQSPKRHKSPPRTRKGYRNSNRKESPPLHQTTDRNLSPSSPTVDKVCVLITI